MTRSIAISAAVARNIRRHRRARKMTQALFAERLGLSRTAFVNIEAGRQSLTLDQFVACADVLNVPVVSLLPFYHSLPLGERPERAADV